MTCRATVYISQRTGSVEGCTVNIQPGLTYRMSRAGVTVMTSSRTITVKPARCMTLSTDSRSIGEVG